ncbi:MULTISPECIES: AI-2E family transporter [Bacillaceae]|uniref:AI-2E family transporter n=1 Tax=Bacillaceae TaxID=186817 RepID=UPI000BED9998|nr:MULTISPECIES: AI-2E family transporter [unclassified Bacillus (in: firmicutes)]PEC47357.1 AI-2E family transporter [Bacillus sp. AFS096315]PFM76053.1 AI-2E family transporter [Bacillus sp. AFS077874]
MDGLKLKWIYRLCLILLIGLVGIVFYYLKPVYLHIVIGVLKSMVPFLIGLIIAYLLHPAIEYIHNKGIKRVIAILLIYLLFFGGCVLGLYLLLPIFKQQWQDILRAFPKVMALYDNFLSKIDRKTSRMPIFLHNRIDLMINGAERSGLSLLNKSGEWMKQLVNNIISLFIIPFIVFYFLKDYKVLSNMFWKIIPYKWRYEAKGLAKELNNTFGKYIRGQILVCFLLFGLATIFLWIVRMKYALVLGVIIGITDIIPYFGPVIGAVPTLFLAASEGTSLLIRVGITLIVLQLIEGNVLSPLIIGKSIHTHPVIIMFSLLVAGEIAGFIGLLIAVPLLVVIISVIRYYSNRKERLST